MDKAFDDQEPSMKNSFRGGFGFEEKDQTVPPGQARNAASSGEQKQSQSSNTDNQNSNQETHVPPAAKAAAAGDARVAPPAPIPAGQSQEAALTPREIPKGNLPPSPLPCSDKTAPR